jgi:L-amino acid N-acyltransferase YncA
MHMRQVTTGDADRIAEIYNWYILNTIITFETDELSKLLLHLDCGGLGLTVVRLLSCPLAGWAFEILKIVA